MNQRKHTHENNNLMTTLEMQALNIDTSNRSEKRRLRRKLGAVALSVATIGAVFAASATRPEAATPKTSTPTEIGEASWIEVAKYDDYGEGGIQVFVDTVSQMRPDLIVYSVDDNGEMSYDKDETISRIEDEFGVNVNHEGGKIQQIAGGDNVQFGAEVLVEYDGKRFHYSPNDN